MNMNKTEKLLAARKRLKEFQLNRKNHHQDVPVKEQNDLQKETPPLIEDSSVDCLHNNGTDVPSPSKIIKNTETRPEEAPVLFDHFMNDHVEESCFGNTSNETPLNHSASLQKERLLQMASAVADALVDHPDNDESGHTSDLEYQNQFLVSSLQEQKELVNRLHIQVAQYSSRISELEATLATKEADFEVKLLRELNPLKEQLQVHAQTTGILVGEKAELAAALTQVQATAKQKAAEVEDLSAKLKSSQLRICELEKELTPLRSISNDVESREGATKQMITEMSEKVRELSKNNDDYELEISELKQNLELKNTQLLSVHQELKNKDDLLSLCELKVQQLTNSQESDIIENQRLTVAALEQQLNQVRQTLKTVSEDKEKASVQYGNYMSTINSQYESALKELEKSKELITQLELKERSYIDRLSDMEQQLQREKDKVESLTPAEDYKNQIESLTKNVDELLQDQHSVQLALSEKDNELENLRKELEELQAIKSDAVEASKLVAALESEKIGASRAVSQNHQLKQQLGEMHDAFVHLSNSKLDLTEQLQAERGIGKKLNAELNKFESEIEKLREELRVKEAALVEYEKEKLHTAQITDQMQHYQAQSHHASTLQQELQKALETIENLKKENQKLFAQQHFGNPGNVPQEVSNVKETIETLKRENQQLLNQHVSANSETVSEDVENVPVNDSEDKVDDSSLTLIQSSTQTVEKEEPSIQPEAVRKLEEKFKTTMEKIAELSDEKQRLEHLVLQLQGETETIGEYITLYQRQRAILNQKQKEREEAFYQLIEQRNQQQEQLHKLKVLVADLISKQSTTENPVDNLGSNHEGDHNENVDVPDVSIVENSEIQSIVHPKDETTSQILDLLTEIKDCKDTCILEPNFHPCPWCSGKLITL
ncbi:golgin subfamily A member 2 isoform X2 [Cephus cinctus]|uniref:Golgin subfamily A member 2 isoform X2 n=1 Tax=Cephus cinctus TaxID=211228 RepID=A0AAJ7RTI9_CEPCN|nr:golgin subfamily A member 2 isoform X2 [Cephus cinctus]